MQVFLLATDEENKLAPLAERWPAPLAPVVDRPVMARVLELLARSELKQAWVGLYRLPARIERHFADGRRYGVHLDYLLQREPLGSAGSLKWAAARLGAASTSQEATSAESNILVLPADHLLDLDVEAAEAYHRHHGGPATAILIPRVGASENQAGSSGRISALAGETAAVSGFDGIFDLSGAYILEPRVLELIPNRTRFDLARDLLPLLLGESGIGLWGYVSGGYWNPLRTMAQFREAQRVYLHSAWASRSEGDPEPAAGPRVRYPSLAGVQIAPGIWAGHNLAIHPSVRLAPPVYLGDNCQVGREVELGPLAVLGPNVVVDDEATIRESVVLEHTYVGRLANVVDRLANGARMVDAVTGASTVVVDRFLLAETVSSRAGAGAGRLGDVLGALALLVLASPVLVLAGLGALLSAVAAGQGPRALVRRMVVGVAPRSAPGDQAVAPRSFGMWHLATRRADGRFTPLGRFLERAELDRLPALWNVLVGDLRLVGVQPATEDDVRAAVEDWQRERFTYPAGFSGLWYIQAPPGADADTTAVVDAYYVATRTWRDDLRILWQTPAAWLRRVQAAAPERPGQARPLRSGTESAAVSSTDCYAERGAPDPPRPGFSGTSTKGQGG